MKYLLTSAGIKNRSIHNALLDLLGKPIGDCNALCIPTAGYGHPMGSPGGAWRFISGNESRCPMCGLGGSLWACWNSPRCPASTSRDGLGWVRQADALLVNGGDAVYLGHWMRQSGLADLLPSLDKTVWVGLSAGSMVMTPRVGEEFVETKPSITGDDVTLGVVDFSIFPHVDHPDLPENTMAAAEKWAAGIGCPAYAIDDQTAIKVVDDVVEVVSEGHWKCSVSTLWPAAEVAAAAPVFPAIPSSGLSRALPAARGSRQSTLEAVYDVTSYDVTRQRQGFVVALQRPRVG